MTLLPPRGSTENVGGPPELDLNTATLHDADIKRLQVSAAGDALDAVDACLIQPLAK